MTEVGSANEPLAAPPEMLGIDALPRDVVVDTALGSDTGDEPAGRTWAEPRR